MRSTAWMIAVAAIAPCLQAKRVDAELNRVYRELPSQNKDDPAAAEKIKKAQRAWVAYRDAYLDAMFPAEDKQAEYGSMYSMEADLLLAGLTARQIDALKDLIRGR